MTAVKANQIKLWLDEVAVGRIISSRDLGHAVDITYKQAAHAINQRADFVRVDLDRRCAHWVKKEAAE